MRNDNISTSSTIIICIVGAILDKVFLNTTFQIKENNSDQMVYHELHRKVSRTVENIDRRGKPIFIISYWILILSFYRIYVNGVSYNKLLIFYSVLMNFLDENS